MTEWKEAFIVKLLPVDDIVEAMRRWINPALWRSAIPATPRHRRLPHAATAPAATFHTDAPAGFIHLDVIYLSPLGRRRSYDYVVIGRATHFIYLEILPGGRAATAAEFLNRFPLCVHTC